MPRIRILKGSVRSIVEDWDLVRCLQAVNNNRMGIDNTHGLYYLDPNYYDAEWLRIFLDRDSALREISAARQLLINIRDGLDVVIPRGIDDGDIDIFIPFSNTSSNTRPISQIPSITNGVRPFTLTTSTFGLEHIQNEFRRIYSPEPVLNRLITPEIGDRIRHVNGFEGVVISNWLSVSQNCSVRLDDNSGTTLITDLRTIRITTKNLRVGDKVKLIAGREDGRTWIPRFDGNPVFEVRSINEPSEAQVNSWLRERNGSTPLKPGIKRITIHLPSRPEFAVYSDEVELILNQDEEVKTKKKPVVKVEMKKSKQEELKIPLNNPIVDFKHKRLGDLKVYFDKDTNNRIYGYPFNNNILQFIDIKFKQEDKPYSIFNIKNKEDVNEYISYNNCYSLKLDKDGKVIQVESTDYPSKLAAIKETEAMIKETCLVKVINYNNSGDVFGYKPTKKEMLNKYYKIQDIDHNYYHEDSKTNMSIVILNSPKTGKSLKFIISDLEFIVPNPDLWLKSYNIPKDRNIRQGVTVRVTNDKYGKVVKNEILKVKSFDQANYILNIGQKRTRPEPIRDEESLINESPLDRLARLTEQGARTTRRNIRFNSPFQGIKNRNKSKSKVNPNCNVWCINKEGKEVKVKLKQLKVV